VSKKEYVYRDVSSRNILVVYGKGKLADLEYARIIKIEGLEQYVRVYGISQLFTYLYLREQLPSWRWRSLMVIANSL